MFVSQNFSLNFAKIDFTKNLIGTGGKIREFSHCFLLDDFDDDDADAGVEEDSDDNAVVSMMPKGREQVLRSEQGVLRSTILYSNMFCAKRRKK